MAIDKFASFQDTLVSPASSVTEIVPSDDADLAEVTLALNVATPGTVRVTAKSGSLGDVFIGAGVVFPLRVRKVWATGTTATGIRALR